jgi:trehalose-phosphatase
MRLGGLRELLAAIPAGRPLILALDYDGTLVPIFRGHHAHPRTPPETRRVLLKLSRSKSVKLMFASGRLLADVERRVGVRRAAYIGNHGLEAKDARWRWVHPEARRARPEMRRLALELRAPVASVRGASLEDKELSLSLHFRGVKGEAGVRTLRREVKKALAKASRPFRVLHGKKVWNLKPDVGWNKGKGLLHWLKARRLSGTLVFAGDDRTDEEGFRALGRRALNVKVGRGPTKARYRLTQRDIRRFLQALADR